MKLPHIKLCVILAHRKHVDGYWAVLSQKDSLLYRRSLFISPENNWCCSLKIALKKPCKTKKNRRTELTEYFNFNKMNSSNDVIYSKFPTPEEICIQHNRKGLHSASVCRRAILPSFVASSWTLCWFVAWTFWNVFNIWFELMLLTRSISFQNLKLTNGNEVNT